MSCSPLFIGMKTIVICFLIVLGQIVTAEVSKKSGTANSFFFKTKPRSQDVEEGHYIRLNCEVNPKKFVGYKWSRNGEPIKFDSRIRLAAEENGVGDLVIKNADRDIDDGNYTCIAFNKSSSVKINTNPARVTVYWMKPDVRVVLLKPARKEDIRMNQPVILKCDFMVYPQKTFAKVKWYRNGKLIRSSDDPSLPQIDSSTGNLILSMRNFAQAGSYQCVVSHSAGIITSRPPFIIYLNALTQYEHIQDDKDYLIQRRYNSTVRFTCPMENKVYFWTFTKKLGDKMIDKLVDIKNIKIIQSRTIEITRLTPENAGIYFCDVRSLGMQEGPKLEVAFHVEIAANYNLTRNQFSPPGQADRPYPVKMGEDFILRFYIDLSPKDSYFMEKIPNPSPKIQWLDPGNQLIPYSDDETLSNTRRITAIYGRHLQIKKAKSSDTGVYKILVSNQAGVKRMDFTIVTTYQPNPVTVRESVIVIDEGRHVILQCGFENLCGHGTNHFRWVKDDRPINLDPSQYFLNKRTGDLNITNALHEHSGSYKCFVKTDKYEEELNNHPITVRVKTKLRIRMKPMIPLELNIPGRIRCKATGYGDITTKWFKEEPNIPDRFVRVEDKNLGTEIEDDGSLVIHLVNNHHRGRYKCVAESTYKKQKVEKIVNVTVGEKPLIHDITNNLTIPENSFLLLNCEFTGKPQPYIEWKKEIANDVFHFTKAADNVRWKVFDNGSLIMREAWLADQGLYTCIVGNFLGTKKKSVYVRILTKEDFDSLNGDSPNNMTRTIVIVVSCALSYLALIVLLTVVCSYRMMKKKKNIPNAYKMGAENGYLLNHRMGNQTLSSNEHRFRSPRENFTRTADSKSHHSAVSSAKSASMYNRSNGSGAPLDVCHALAYDRQNIFLEGILGKGEFGEVFLARAPKIQEGEPQSLVILKSLTSREPAHVHEFQRQMDIFAKVDHEYVGKLLGLCLEKDPQMLILEYCEWGDLKQFLSCMRNPQTQMKVSALTQTQKITMCAQVAMAMEHLANLRITHRDLAARNVMLTQNLNLKVSLLGLSRDTYSDDYYRLDDDCVIPLRWSAPEVINSLEYSTPADVWSYGIFVWEVFTLCEKPYHGHQNDDLLVLAKKLALKPVVPTNCPVELQILLRRCWHEIPKQRPTFSDISLILGNLTVDLDL